MRVMLYDRPVRELLAVAVAEVDQPSRPSDYVNWFARHYPAVKENTVRMHLTAYTANDRNRRHHANARRRPALLYRRPDDRLEPYDASVHGAFDEFGEPRDPTVLGAEPEPAVPSTEEAAMEFLLESYLEEFLGRQLAAHRLGSSARDPRRRRWPPVLDTGRPARLPLPRLG
jgi:endonuclease